MDTLLGLNDWAVAEAIGPVLYDAGYNVYVKLVYEDDVVDFAMLVGDWTVDDVFLYLGHGCNGKLALPYRHPREGYRHVEAAEFPLGSRKFKIVHLTACASGGDCGPSCGNWLDSFIGLPSCAPSQQFQDDWSRHLLGNLGGGLVGYVTPVRTVTANSDLYGFVHSLAAGLTVAESFLVLNGDFYFRGDPRTTLR